MIRKACAAWNNFWFEPVSPAPMALFRILIGLVVLEVLLVDFGPDLLNWFGQQSIVSLDTVRAGSGNFGPRLDLFLLLPSNDLSLAVAFGVLVLFAGLLTIGLATRLSAVVVLLGLISLHNHNPLAEDGPTSLLRLALFYLVLSGGGRAFSLDSLLESLKTDWRKSGFGLPKCWPWAQRLMQVQLSALYLECVVTKLQGSTWRDGTAVYYTSRIQSLTGFDIPYVFDHMWTLKLLTWGTIAVELALATVIWFKPLRYWVMGVGILFHLMMELSMSIPLFQWLMVSCYVTFVEPRDLERLGSAVSSVFARIFGRPATLLYDGEHIQSVRIAGLLKRLDVFQRLRLMDVCDYAGALPAGTGRIAPRDNIIISADGQALDGVRAVRWLALRLPLLWVVVPLMLVPAINHFIATLMVVAGKAITGQGRLEARNDGAPIASGRSAVAVLSCCAWGALLLLAVVSALVWMKPVAGYVRHKEVLSQRERQFLLELRQLGINDPLERARSQMPAVARPAAISGRSLNVPTSVKRTISMSSNGRKHNADEPEASEKQLRSMAELAACYWQEMELEKAALLYSYIWTVRAKQAGDRFDPELLSTVRAIAALYRDAGLYALSAQCYRYVLDYAGGYSMATPQDRVGDLTSLALALYHQGCAADNQVSRQKHFQEADLLYRTALKDCSAQPGDCSQVVQQIMANRNILLRDVRAGD